MKWCFVLLWLTLVTATGWAQTTPLRQVTRFAPDWSSVVSVSNKSNNAHDPFAATRAVQFLLRYHGFKSIAVDGIFGRETDAAVKRFQTCHGLRSDGVVGPKTWAKLVVGVKPGDRGDSVRALQTVATWLDGPVDGYYGPQTRKTVLEMQSGINDLYEPSPSLKVDGIVGPQTWAALLTNWGGD